MGPSSAEPFLEPPPPTPAKLPTLRPHNSSDEVIYNLLEKEKKIMIQRAISSAAKHGIDLVSGTPNPGTGDCAFEAIVSNINDRSSFKVKFPLNINYYRRIWVTDMANRTLHTDINIYTNHQWLDGWNEMLVPGTYERGIFGDLMVPGIACGVRKYLLIFNTNVNTPHDPIYIVNPADYNVPPDTDIPVVLAYNMSHYESMEPRSETDVRMTINLVKQYLEGRYRYRNHDLQYLISTQALRKEDALFNNTEMNNLTRIVTEEINNDQDKHRTIQGGKKRAKLENSNEENIGDQDDISCSSLHSKKNPDRGSRHKDQDMA